MNNCFIQWITDSSAFCKNKHRWKTVIRRLLFLYMLIEYISTDKWEKHCASSLIGFWQSTSVSQHGFGLYLSAQGQNSPSCQKNEFTFLFSLAVSSYRSDPVIILGGDFHTGHTVKNDHKIVCSKFHFCLFLMLFSSSINS